MGNKLNSIEIKSEFNHLNIKEITDSGGLWRRVLTPDMDVSGEVAEIQEKTESLWTNEVKDKWATFQAEQEAKLKE